MPHFKHLWRHVASSSHIGSCRYRTFSSHWKFYWATLIYRGGLLILPWLVLCILERIQFDLMIFDITKRSVIVRDWIHDCSRQWKPAWRCGFRDSVHTGLTHTQWQQISLFWTEADKDDHWPLHKIKTDSIIFLFHSFPVQSWFILLAPGIFSKSKVSLILWF